MIKTDYTHIKKRGTIMDLLEIIKALSHENRLRILNLIKDRELCVCEIEYVLEINQSNASRHLNKLKQSNLIIGKKKAQWIYYRINKGLFEKHKFLKNILEKELVKIDFIKKDNQNLKDYLESDISCSDIS